MKTRRPGFTLFELLVVMVILALVGAIVIGAVNRVGTSARKGETMGRLRAIAASLAQYREDWGDVPPYNPRGDDLDGDSNPDGPGAGLYALLAVDYLRNYRMLHDPASPVDLPFVDNAGTLLKVVPGDDRSMGTAYQALINGGWVPGTPMGPQELYETYVALADPALHDPPGTLPTDYGDFEEYNLVENENYCSWLMADPYSTEWKYLPVRQGEPSPSSSAPAGTAFPVDASLAYPSLYHRQLSHRWTDEDSPSYLPAADTVVTWSNLYRTTDRRPAFSRDDWGQDLILYLDGHISTLPGPADSAAGDWTQGRAVQRPAP